MADQRLIDANALLEKRRRFYEPRELESIAPIASTCITTDDVYRAPTIDAVPVVHGRWCYEQCNTRPRLGSWYCSACERSILAERVAFSKYCPNCGAKMDGGAADEHNLPQA